MAKSNGKQETSNESNTSTRESSSSKNEGKSSRSRREKKATPTSQQGAVFTSTISEQLVKDVASFSFATPLGSRNYYHSSADTYNNVSVPGIMRIGWIPSVGWADSPTSPVNLAARSLMTRIRAANSGRRNYDQNALMLYILSVDSAFMFLEWMKRSYGMMQLANAQNKNIPEALVASSGVIFSDMLLNMAAMRAYINVFASRLFALPVPKIPLIDRHRAMSSGIYADSESPKAQLYLFVPDAFYQYSWDSVNETTFLNLVASGINGTTAVPGGLSFSQMRSMGELILDGILITYGEEDFALIGGDILKAYGEDGVYRASGISDDFTVPVTYDPVMLMRIQNSVGYGLLDANQNVSNSLTEYDVRVNVASAPVSSFLESKPSIVFNGAIKPSLTEPCYSRLLLSQTGPLTPEQAIEALTFTNILSPPSDISSATGIYNYTTAGTEIVTRYHMLYYTFTDGLTPLLTLSAELNSDTGVRIVEDEAGSIDTATVTNAVVNTINTIAMYSNFDWAPLLTYRVDVLNPAGTVSSDYQKASFMLGDINDYALVTREDLERVRSIKVLVDLGL